MADDLDKENQETDFSFDDDSSSGGMDDGFNDFNSQQSLGNAIQNNMVLKIGVIAAAVVFIIGGFLLFGGATPNEERNTSSVGTAGSNLKQAPTTEQVTQTMQEAIGVYNEEGGEEAEKTGGSFIPVPMGPAQNTGIAIPEEEAIQEDPLERWRLLQEERANQQRQQLELVNEQRGDPNELSIEEQRRQEAVQTLAQSMLTSMSELGQSSVAVSMNVEPLLDDKKYYEKLKDEANEDQIREIDRRLELIEKRKELSEVDPSIQEVNEGIETLLISEGTVEYAQMLIQANSDIPGPVLAQLVTGPLAGSRLIGDFTVEDDYLVISFDSVVVNGISLDIEAVAIDPSNNLTGVATEVDHRYFKRLILPVAAEFISGFASAVAETQDSTFVTGDVVIVSNNDLDTDEEVAQAIEDAGERVGEFVDEEARKTKVLVKVAAGTPIGILFTEPVVRLDPAQQTVAVQ